MFHDARAFTHSPERQEVKSMPLFCVRKRQKSCLIISCDRSVHTYQTSLFEAMRCICFFRRDLRDLMRDVMFPQLHKRYVVLVVTDFTGSNFVRQAKTGNGKSYDASHYEGDNYEEISD
jgi:hypothetical protein